MTCGVIESDDVTSCVTYDITEPGGVPPCDHPRSLTRMIMGMSPPRVAGGITTPD